jgi:hypothetical protein
MRFACWFRRRAETGFSFNRCFELAIKFAIAKTRSLAGGTRHLGLNTQVILDGCRRIELEPGDIHRALNEMKRAGAILMKSGEL